MPSYQPRFDAGDEIFLDGRYATVLDREDGEYYLARKGRFRWFDCSEIDAIAQTRDQVHG